MTLKAALLQGQKLLEDAGVASPRLTAEVLLAYAINRDRVWLYAHSTDELIELWWIHYGRYLHQRIQGKPTQYITHKQEFYGREFHVTPDVLIPRPETEHIIEATLTQNRDREGAETILDVGTGSGIIAITLALETNAHITATEISPAALRVAEENARLLNAHVEFIECDLIPPNSTFDLIVSNPPYVALRDKPTLEREVREHEPELALFGGEDGLDVYHRLIPAAARALNSGGSLVLEIGAEQAEAVSAMLASWHAVEIRKDLAGLPRVAIARKP